MKYIRLDQIHVGLARNASPFAVSGLTYILTWNSLCIYVSDKLLKSEGVVITVHTNRLWFRVAPSTKNIRDIHFSIFTKLPVSLNHLAANPDNHM